MLVSVTAHSASTSTPLKVRKPGLGYWMVPLNSCSPQSTVMSKLPVKPSGAPATILSTWMLPGFLTRLLVTSMVTVRPETIVAGLPTIVGGFQC